MAAMLVSFLLLTAVVLRSHSASWPAIGPTSAPDTDSKLTPDNGSTSNARNALRWEKRTKTSFAEWLNRRRRDIATTTTTRAHTTTTRAHTTTARAHTTTTRAHTTIRPTHTRTPRPRSRLFREWLNRQRRRTTTPPRRHTTPTPWSGHRNYDRDKEAGNTSTGLYSVIITVGAIPVIFCCICIIASKKKYPSDEADTTINREIGPFQPPEASPHTEGTTAPYGSIDQADNSLPTYNQALSMPSSYGHTPVPLSAPSLDDGRSPPAYSEINMQLSTSAIRVSTVGWAARSPVASVNNMTTMTRY
ncbi:hypothetical protein LSAT2_018018 [Lamellibrachia satsuma]|nr:hypothetical protein LSAT2_018018 [Lamellibrachia satsuma]